MKILVILLISLTIIISCGPERNNPNDKLFNTRSGDWMEITNSGLLNSKSSSFELFYSMNRLNITYIDSVNQWPAVRKFVSSWVPEGDGYISSETASTVTALVPTANTPHFVFTNTAGSNGSLNILTEKIYDNPATYVYNDGKNVSYPQIYIFNSNGTDIPYISYCDAADNYKLTVKKFDAATSQWVTLGSSNFSQGNAMNHSLFVYNNSGTPIPYVAYRNGGSTSKIICKKFDGTNWENYQSDDEGFSDATVGQDFIWIDMYVTDTEGKPYIVYYGGSGALASFYNGPSWAHVAIDHPTGLWASDVKIKEYNNLIYLAYQYYDTSSSTKCGYVEKCDLSVASCESMVDSDDFTYGGDDGSHGANAQVIDFTIDAGGAMYVAYNDGSLDYKITVRKLNGTDSWDLISGEGFTSGGYMSPSLSLTSAGGNPTLLVYDMGDSRIKAYRYNQISWEFLGNTALSSSMGGSVSAAATENGVYVAYPERVYGMTETSVIVCKKFISNQWESIFNAPFASDFDRLNVTHSSRTTSGNIYMSYLDKNAGNKLSLVQYNANFLTQLGTGVSDGEVGDSVAAYLHDANSSGHDIVYLAYTDYTRNNDIFIKKYEGGVWSNFQETGVTGEPATPLYFYVATSDNDFSIEIIYRDDNSKKIYSRTYGDSWNNPTLLVGGPTDMFSIISNYNDNYLAFTDSKYNNKMTVMYKEENQSWSYLGSRGFTSGTPSALSIVTAGSIPVIAYSDSSRDNQIRIMKFKFDADK